MLKYNSSHESPLGQLCNDHCQPLNPHLPDTKHCLPSTFCNDLIAYYANNYNICHVTKFVTMKLPVLDTHILSHMNWCKTQGLSYISW
jgi:hypothetical protein